MTEPVTAALAAVVHEDDPARRAEVAALFAGAVFDSREGLTHTEKCGLTYERMAVLNGRLPAARELLEDRGHLLAVLEAAAVVSPSLFLAATIHYCLGVNAVVEFGGGRDDLSPWLEDLESMSSVGTLVVTEAGHGNSHTGIRTEARHDPGTGGFVLRTPDPGARKFMSNNGLPGVAKVGVVYARLLAGGADRGVFPFVTPLRDGDGPAPGVRIEALPETPAVPLDYALIEFDDVRLPMASLLSDSAVLTGDGTFHDPLGDPALRLRRSLTVREHAWAASAVALAAVSRAAVAVAVGHAHHRTTRSRHSGPRPVLDFRPQQRALFGALAAAYGSTFLVNRARRAWAGEVDDKADHEAPEWSGGLGRTLGLAKASACWTATHVTTECGLRSGAHGMFGVNRVVDYQGLAHILNPAAGDNHLIALDAGRALVEGEHYTPPGHHARRPADLRDPHAVLGLAAARERALHDRLAGELDTARRRGQEPFEVWNNRLPLARELADAHVQRLELTCFAEAVAAVTDPRARKALTALLHLHAVTHAATHLGWYLANDLLSTADADRIPALLNGLCEHLMPHARALADAVAPPATLLTAPLREPDYMTYRPEGPA